MIFIKEVWLIPMKSQVYNLSRYKEMTVLSGQTIMKARLEKQVLVRKGNLTLELRNSEMEDCRKVRDLYICPSIGGILQIPGTRACASSVELQMNMEDIVSR